MKPVRLPAAATLALPRWALYALGMLYILPGLIGRDPWKDDGGSFGLMWTMAHGTLSDWLLPNIAGMPIPEDGPLAFWLGALCIKLFGFALGDVMAARMSTIAAFVLGALSVWYTAFHLGRRPDAQPLRLAFGGQPEPRDYGRTLADTALLFYLGCLGLLLHSHSTVAATLEVSLLAYFLYRTVRYVEVASVRNAALVGLALGALTLTRGWVVPAALAATLLPCTLFLRLPVRTTLRDFGVTLATAGLVALLWMVPAMLLRPYHQSPIDAWQTWNMEQVGLPSVKAFSFFLRQGIWFFWPAWPFALWAIYAWRRQSRLLHIVLPLTVIGALTLLALCDPTPEQWSLLLLLPPLSIMAAFGLPTMKRGAINAIDWFSVMVLTMVAGLIWLFWIATLTGWPAQLAKNALKLVPGFTPSLGPVAFMVAAGATVLWFALVHWRLSRQPAVLWRAVVLSSGGLILIWVLLMTLFLPELNYSKSYARVALQIAAHLPEKTGCIESNVGPAQREAFAYFGNLPFTGVEGASCDVLLLQDSIKRKDDTELLREYRDKAWVQLWEGRRPSDRDERFRLYRRGK